MTFSIVGRCRRTGEFGVAAATAMPAVGSLLAHARAGTGAVATQARVNPYLGIDGLKLLARGFSASTVVDELAGLDPRFDLRQVGIVDSAGRSAAWTGEGCPFWAGHICGEDFSVQGNRLESEEVLHAAAGAFLERSDRPLVERLIDALTAGNRKGGDRKDEQSASVYVVGSEDYPLWDIRVDEHDEPIADLRRQHGVFSRELHPHILRMPTRANPAGAHGEEPV